MAVNIGRLVDRLTTLSMLVASVTLVLLAVQARVARRAHQEYAVGDTFRSARLPQTGDAGTLVMFVSPTCPYCERSIAFYRAIRSRAKTTRVIVVGREPSDVLARHYEGKNGFTADQFVTLDVSDQKLQRSPTLLLLGTSLDVRQVWFGLLDAAREAEVLSNLR